MHEAEQLCRGLTVLEACESEHARLDAEGIVGHVVIGEEVDHAGTSALIHATGRVNEASASRSRNSTRRSGVKYAAAQSVPNIAW
jgi:hypothetical protein